MLKKSRRTRVVSLAPRLELERLDGRALPSITLQHGILNVGGTSAADVINVDVGAEGSLHVELNGRGYNFDMNLVRGLRVYTRGGDDSLSISDLVSLDATVRGGPGNDSLTGGGGDDSIRGDSGNDEIEGGTGDDSERGDVGNDELHGDGDDDDLDGGAGDDDANGGDGDDVLVGGFGNDHLDGGLGHDEMHGDDGDDNLDGAEGDDYVDGGEGNDDCVGGDGDDVMDGGGGDDHLDGEAGSNVVDGDAGSNVEDHGESAHLRSMFAARLDGPTDAKGGAMFYSRQDDAGNSQMAFLVRVEHAAEGTYHVTVDDVAVGDLSVDASGQGKLTFFSTPHEEGQAPFPVGFPTIHAGSEVRISSDNVLLLDGWFHSLGANTVRRPEPRPESHPTPPPVVASGFKARLTGATEAVGAATFARRTTDGGAERLFGMHLEHAPRGSYDVRIDGTVVGHVTVGEFGFGRLGFATTPHEAGQYAFPDGFPEIHAGSVLHVGSGETVLVQGTFEAWVV